MDSAIETTVHERIDPVTLDTMERKNLMVSVAIVNHTSHPHVMSNGDVCNIGMSLVKGRLQHVEVKFPFTEKGDMFHNAHLVGAMKPRWALHPSYMHTFDVTNNYFVIVEQPLAVSVCGLVRNQITNQPLVSSLQWYAEYRMNIVLICRESGREVKRFETETLFFLHIINCFESNNNLILDLCAYKDTKVLDAMYIQAIEAMRSNADYADWFRGRPKRLEMGLMPQTSPEWNPDCWLIWDARHPGPITIYITENPTDISISSDVDGKNPGLIIKVDILTGDTVTWYERDFYPGAPVFVPHPDAKSEDDGVVLSALVQCCDEKQVYLVCLCSKTLLKLARCSFRKPSLTTKCLHGWFLPA